MKVFFLHIKQSIVTTIKKIQMFIFDPDKKHTFYVFNTKRKL